MPQPEPADAGATAPNLLDLDAVKAAGLNADSISIELIRRFRRAERERVRQLLAELIWRDEKRGQR